MNYLRNWLILLLNIVLLDTYSQIQITFPVSRIVFQRNNQNQATVNIAGSYFQQLDKVEARAVPVWGGQGTETGWNAVQEFKNNGIFSGTIQLNGGWYNIEVRGILNGNIITTSTLERVGVGEVFIVAGQSNAQGDQGYSGATIGATDDRVSTINYYDPALNEDNLPFQFSQMGNNTKMAPYNYVPWFWAKLGDKLAQRLNVPVLFYGAALGGLSCEVWRRSAEGQDLRQELPTFVKVAGMPYRGMKAALQQYVTRTGVRAILWQQGESDGSSSGETYYNNLRTVIEKSRSDSKKDDLAWVVARSSRNPSILPTVIEGQNLTIQRVPNVFSGPPTDEIVGANFRADGIHFHNDGLWLASDYWNNYLDGNFFSNSQPLMARNLPVITIACNPNNTTNKFTIITGGYPLYKWSNGGTSNFITVSNGTFSFKGIDEVGNTIFSQPFTISTNNNVTQPVISANGNTTFCDGQGVVLTSNISSGNVWSNGERGQSIVARGSGNYSVVNYSLNGCASPASSSINVNVLPSPFNFINASKSLPICPDETVELFTTNNDGTSYTWNTNETSKRITVNKAGSYSLRIKGQNGCESQSFIDVNFRSRPSTNILADGETTFCLGKSVNIFPQNDFSSYMWNTGATTKTLNVRTDGTYTLRVKDNFGCVSDAITKKITVNALPVVKIKADGVDKFCEGNVVILSPQIQSALGYRWSTGESSKEIYVVKDGLYTLSVRDENGCESTPDSIKLTYIPSPIASITSSENINTICDGSSLSLVSNDATAYAWSTGATSKGISVDKAGVYSLKIKDDKSCLSKAVSFEVFVKESPPTPSVSLEGSFQLHAIPKTNFDNQLFSWKRDTEQLSTISAILKANASGMYSVRAVWKYLLSNNKELLCYSPYSSAVEVFIPYLDNGFRIYPNPNPTGIFTVETIGDSPNAEVAVFTLTGQKVYSGSFSDLKEKRTLDLRQLEKGVYIIRLVSGSYEASSRVILK
ncbi:hypothetical protein GCM10011514_24800 [Emticicia aquatilis]|uniref:T9SS C-terminal target domain-containing protein n=1 Tax=Emticicia aquatilis TaxID=1537369 RepID=A0A916YSQ9_9BACT|nr:T9SS type A sorting domain-containing protein [Emticicia aquatilis]GGD59868.1 hypothetical protein GCM10011514_24800 [Emticicia aquatilis]